jgi:NRAMP (natural resistance-associated macrophage protein)-like metal ion transporter
MERIGRISRRRFWRRLSIFLAVMGPGIITANVDNDAGGLATYSQAGTIFGSDILWVFIPITVLLIIVQEMVNRMGVVTGQGLSDLIRERFGARITFYVMLFLLLTNFGNIMAEFAGIASAARIFGIPKLISVPLCALGVWMLVLKGTYKSVEKIFLIACLFYIAYPITFVILKPDLVEVSKAFVTPKIHMNPQYLIMVMGLIGTTIAPWMQFFQQSTVVEKNIRIKEYAFSRIDTIVGCIVVNIVAACIVIVCAYTLHPAHVSITTAADAAAALKPLAGIASSALFAIGLLNASLFAASILPLSTAYTICEAMGWESGVDESFETAPQFYVLYTALIVLGAVTILIPGISMMKVMFWSQVVNGLLLPVILVFILLLINDQRTMGTWVNGKIYNTLTWISVSLLSIAGISSIATFFF